MRGVFCRFCQIQLRCNLEERSVFIIKLILLIVLGVIAICRHVLHCGGKTYRIQQYRNMQISFHWRSVREPSVSTRFFCPIRNAGESAVPTGLPRFFFWAASRM